MILKIYLRGNLHCSIRGLIHKINHGVKMNFTNKTKKKWSLFFLFLIFFSFIISLIRFAGADTYLLMKNADKIYYDSKGILGLSGVPFIFFFYVYIFINFIIADTNILARTQKDKKKTYDITMKYLGPVIILSIFFPRWVNLIILCY